MQRSEKKKWIERGKTAMIVSLAFCCVYLLYLLLDIYSEQIYKENVSWNSNELNLLEIDKKSTDEVLCGSLSPETVFINGTSSHQKVSEDSLEYRQLIEELGENLQKVYLSKAEDIAEVEWEDWTRALSEYGVYVKYPVSHRTEFLGEVLGIKDSSFQKNIDSYRELIFTTGVVVDMGVTVFVREDETDKIIKISLDADAIELRNIMKRISNKNENIHMFAFELNFHEEKIKGETRGVSFDSMLMLPSDAMEMAGVSFDVPRRYRGGISFSGATDVTSGLTGLFGFNPNTIRQYSNSDGTLMFVGDTGSLSVHPSGKIEYKSLGESEGILLVNDARNSDGGQVFSRVLAFKEKIFDICGMNDEKHEAELKMTEFDDAENGLMKFGFEYFVDGGRVLFPGGPAMYGVVRNGVLTEFKIQIKNIEKSGGKKEITDMFEAIDDFLATNSAVNKISDGRTVYKYTEDKRDTFGTWEIQGGLF